MPTKNPFQPDFWDSDESDLWDDIAETMLDIYLQGVDGGVNALPNNIRVLADWDLVNTSALEFAKNYRYSLIRGITDTTRKQTQKAVSDWIASGSPLDALETALSGVFGASRAERIAVTEATRVFSQGNLEAWEGTGLVSEAVWMTARDDLVCPVCGELDGTTVGIGDIDAAPPGHISCRCWLQPVLDMEALEEALNE
jgi:SPP1 gp7 family putative phage head morphogenesis protein